MIKINSEDVKEVRMGGDWELKFEIPAVKKGDKIWVDVHSTDMDCKQDGRNNRWYKIATHDKKSETVTEVVKARELLELIAKNMCNNAEPGIQNIDIARKYSNSDYFYDPKAEYDSRIISTNACCVDGSTKVMTDRGEISIKEVYDLVNAEKKVSVMSYNIETDKYEMKFVNNVWQQRNDSTVTLYIEESGKEYEIECSSDHPILTKNRGYVRADSLTNEDDITIFR